MSVGNIEFVVKEKRRIESFAHSGQLDKARKIAEKLCRKQKQDAECWFLLGAVCGQQGDFSRAVECCRQTVKLAPHVAVAYLNLGVALHNTGQLEEAIKSLSKSLQLQPNTVAVYRELGFIYNELGDYLQSINSFNEFVRIQSDDPSIWLILGNLYEKQPDVEKAESCYRKSFSLDPNSVAAGVNLGNVLKVANKPAEAELVYKSILQVKTEQPDVLFNLAVLYQSIYKYEKAERYYLKVLDIQPSNMAAQLNLGNVYLSSLQYDRASELLLQILEKEPNSIDARRNLSAVYKEQYQLDLAKNQLEIIFNSNSDDIKTRQDYALILLQQGHYLKGWQEYEWRTRGLDAVACRWPYTSWTINDSLSKTVLVYPEQGIGDEIMFSSCVADLAEHVDVVLACDKRLEPLFQRSFPNVEVIGRQTNEGDEWLKLLPKVDSQVSIASLPLYFRQQREKFPVQNSYLKANSESLKKWQSRYESLEGKVTVGISWRGGHETNTKMKRSNDLANWKSVLQLTDVNFVNLQYGDCVSDIKQVKELFDVTLYDWDDSDPLLELDDFSAKIKALDLVVSIDNSTVHFSGALGVPTWILQPFSPDWRWIKEHNDSYWYRTVKQYFQPVPGDWSAILDNLADDLTELVSNNVDK